jgi:hypothetical protein
MRPLPTSFMDLMGKPNSIPRYVCRSEVSFRPVVALRSARPIIHVQGCASPRSPMTKENVHTGGCIVKGGRVRGGRGGRSVCCVWTLPVETALFAKEHCISYASQRRRAGHQYQPRPVALSITFVRIQCHSTTGAGAGRYLCLANQGGNRPASGKGDPWPRSSSGPIFSSTYRCGRLGKRSQKIKAPVGGEAEAEAAVPCRAYADRPQFTSRKRP